MAKSEHIKEANGELGIESICDYCSLKIAFFLSLSRVALLLGLNNKVYINRIEEGISSKLDIRKVIKNREIYTKLYFGSSNYRQLGEEFLRSNHSNFLRLPDASLGTKNQAKRIVFNLVDNVYAAY